MPQENLDPLTVARNTFDFIKSKFPHLNIEIDEHPTNRYIDAELIILTQNGLSFEIRVMLSGDELTLALSEFHWHFSCADLEEQEWCIETVVRLVTNQARLKESLWGKRVRKSELQVLHEGQWVTDAVTGAMLLPSFAKKTIRYIQNTDHLPE
jgi:hypothetical protein